MAVHPEPFELPTGNELMSTPIYEGGPSRAQKEIEFVIKNIQHRLRTLILDEKYEVNKTLLFAIGILSAMVGLTLVFYGLNYSVFFEHLQNKNYIAVACGSLFFIPLVVWIVYIFIPSKKERRKRKLLHNERKERRKPSLFNELVEDAKRATEPPVRKIRVIAHLRKKDYPITCTTWREFCVYLEGMTGLLADRQLIRYNGEDLEIDLERTLYGEEYGINPGDKLYIYNKGAYMTRSPPQRPKRETISRYGTRSRGDYAEGRPGSDAMTMTFLSALRNDSKKVSGDFSPDIKSKDGSSVRQDTITRNDSGTWLEAGSRGNSRGDSRGDSIRKDSGNFTREGNSSIRKSSMQKDASQKKESRVSFKQ